MNIDVDQQITTRKLFLIGKTSVRGGTVEGGTRGGSKLIRETTEGDALVGSCGVGSLDCLQQIT